LLYLKQSLSIFFRELLASKFIIYFFTPNFRITGTTIVFEVVVDDYSEIWVNGKLGKTFGQAGNEWDD